MKNFSQHPNPCILLKSHPSGMPNTEHFQLCNRPVRELSNQSALVRVLYLSVDPYMRGRLGGRLSSHPPFILGEPLVGDGIGTIIETKSSKFQLGDTVVGQLQWAHYAAVKEDELLVIPSTRIPITAFLSILGMTGMTAYFGLIDIGQPREGETVVISGAAGAVGSTVGQIAKNKGSRAVGITGCDKKAAFLREKLGFDAAINYKAVNFDQKLKEACPYGIDIYFDNVGGMVTERCIMLINKSGRIVLSGQISTYHQTEPAIGLLPYRQLIIKSALARGFLVWDYKDRFLEGQAQMLQWMQEGKMHSAETIVEGLEHAPQAFLGLFTGTNLGKQLVKVQDAAV